MLKLIKLTTKKTKPDQGFSMLEVLVASLIAFGFLIGSLQAMVLAVALRVQAQEKQVANQLIQKEIEDINRIAITLNQNGTSYDVQTSRCSASNYDNGYAKALWDAYVADPAYEATPKQKLSIGTGSSGEDEGKEIGLDRTFLTTNSSGSNAPHKTLKIRYEVKEWDGTNFIGNAIAEDYLEIIPSAALQCP
jgi:type II secretory pathway pseudopilin PulG